MLTGIDGKKLLPRQTAVFDKIQKYFQLPAVPVLSAKAIVDGFHPVKIIGSGADQSGNCRRVFLWRSVLLDVPFKPLGALLDRRIGHFC
jgi:hypothetical protein